MTAPVPLAEQIHGVNNVIAWVERQRLPGGCMEDLECDRSLAVMRATVATLQQHERATSDWQGAVLRFAEAILHGDARHREWLRAAARAYVEGNELPEVMLPPPGQHERAIAALRDIEGDLHMLRAAINSVDPYRELLVRVGDIERVIKAALDGAANTAGERELASWFAHPDSAEGGVK